MAMKLTRLRFDQAANLVDGGANQHAVVTLFKRRTPTPWKPDLAVEATFKMLTRAVEAAPEANNPDEAKPRASRALATNGNEDNMTEMEKRQAWENVIQAEADLIQEVTDCTPEQAYAKALLKRPDAVRKMYGHAEPETAVAKSSDPREQAWAAITAAADRMVMKSRFAMTTEQAIAKVLQVNPKLARDYYGVG